MLAAPKTHDKSSKVHQRCMLWRLFHHFK